MLDRDQLAQIVERVLVQAGAQAGNGHPFEPALLLHSADGWRHEVLAAPDESAVVAAARGDEDAFVLVVEHGDGLAVVAATAAGDAITVGGSAAGGWRMVDQVDGSLDALRRRLASTLLERS
jgi:hypothetical protein